MATLIPRKLRELREELLTVKQDVQVETAAAKALKANAKLSPEQRQNLAAIETRLSAYRARQTELEADIEAEVAKHTERSAVAARAASRATVKTVHERVAARHLERAEQLEQWRALSVCLFADFHAGFAADSAALEAAVLHLTDGDPAQFNGAMEHAVPAVRGNDVNFATALSHAFSDIAVAASQGKVTEVSRARFAHVAEQHVRTLDARLPEIHAGGDADLGSNPELVEESAQPDKWSEAVKATAGAEARRVAEQRAHSEANPGSAPRNANAFVELMTGKKS